MRILEISSCLVDQHEVGGVEEGAWIGGRVLVQDRLPGLIENAQIHASGVQIDAAVESVRLVVATHLVASVVAGRPDPASWLEGHDLF